MRHIGTIIGSAIAGILVFSMWGALAAAYGLMGGWLAAMVTIPLGWGVNHFSGVICNKSEGCWVDMGLGIGVAGTTMGLFQGHSLLSCLPTWAVYCTGGALGGVFAALVINAIAKTESESNN